MSFIDWSDPDEMLGLLAEYVADESVAEHEDPQRATFLEELSTVLTTLAASSQERPVRETIAHLREIHDSQSAEFDADAVLTHLEDCIQELERIAAQREATLD